LVPETPIEGGNSVELDCYLFGATTGVSTFYLDALYISKAPAHY
jgi:hypothetical protein